MLTYFYCAAYIRMKVNESSTNCDRRSHYKKLKVIGKPRKMRFQASSKCRSVHNRCNVTRQTVPGRRSRLRESAFSDFVTKGWHVHLRCRNAKNIESVSRTIASYVIFISPNSRSIITSSRISDLLQNSSNIDIILIICTL